MEARAGFTESLGMSKPTPAHDAAVSAVLDWLAAHDGVDPPLEQLAAVAGVSRGHLQRRFKACTGLSPKEYVASRRRTRFRARVKAGDGVARATYAAGYGSSRGLYDNARVELGMTPARYARGGAGLDIAWTLADASLGRLLVASTSDGVCAVMLGDGDDELTAQLHDEFPNASLARDDDARREWTTNVVRHVDDTRRPLGVPIDHHGTPFQIRVWKALRDIPVGETRTYGQVARAIGSPDAVRAVGRACGQNAIAVLVPCHRVVRKDGGVGGYRWGPDRKTALLRREHAGTAPRATSQPSSPNM